MRSTPVQSPTRPARAGQWRALFLPVLVLASFGCTTEPDTALPSGAKAFVPSASYAGWWSKTEQCAEKNADYQRIEWYVVPGATTFQTPEGEKVGLRIQRGSEIQIVIAEAYVTHEMVVRHEMLHAILGQPGHPSLYFVDRCRLTWDTWIADHGGTASAPAAGSTS